MPEPWVEFGVPRLKKSVTIAAHDPKNRELTVHLEMLPGTSGAPRWDGNWPRPEEIRNEPLGITLSFVDFANQLAGRTYQSPRVIVQFHEGDWHTGQRIYKDWRTPW